jgi:hypothetical protein
MVGRAASIISAEWSACKRQFTKSCWDLCKGKLLKAIAEAARGRKLNAAAYWGGLMSFWKSFGLAIFAVCLLGETTGSAHAQCSPSPLSTSCATEWSAGSVIKLGALPGFTDSVANSIKDDAGQAVGIRLFVGAIEWSDGSVIPLGGLPGSTSSEALGINDAGMVVGSSGFSRVPPSMTVPEPSTWAMMLVGFAGLGYAGYRASRGAAAAIG